MTVKTPIRSNAAALLGLAMLAAAAPLPASRIVSTAPGFTEILFTIGAADQVVAVSDYCLYPEAARAKSKIGGPFNLNYERIVALRPDLVVLPKSLSGVAEKCQALGLQTVRLPNETTRELVESIDALGNLTGRQEAASRLVAEIEKELASDQTPGETRVRTLIVVFRAAESLQDLTVASRDTFLSELLAHAGGENVMSSTISRYPRISKEEVIALDPDVILDLTFTAGGEDTRVVWSQLPTLKAVRTGRIAPLPDPAVTIPGPRMIQTLRRFREILHPPKANP